MRSLDELNQQIDAINKKSINLSASALEESVRLVVKYLIEAGYAGDELVDVLSRVGAEAAKYPEVFKEAAYWVAYQKDKQVEAAEETKKITLDQKAYNSILGKSGPEFAMMVAHLEEMIRVTVELSEKASGTLGVFGDMAAMLMKTLNVLDDINTKLDALNGKTVHTYVKVHEEKA